LNIAHNDIGDSGVQSFVEAVADQDVASDALNDGFPGLMRVSLQVFFNFIAFT
jgi:hypothetical protein